jgi:hypothetical protein
MFIREIKKKFTKGDVSYEYIQHRLVESIRTEHGPRQHTVLNLGSLSLPSDQLKILANLIEHNIKSTQQALPLFGEVPQELIGLARHFADIIIEKRVKSAGKSLDGECATVTQPAPEVPLPIYETIDTNSIITSDSRTIGVEHIALTHLKELDLFTILQNCSFTENEQKIAVAQICARMAHPASERDRSLATQHQRVGRTTGCGF